jgi:hypothetical protein
MAMKRPVVVRALEKVEVDVEEAVAGDDPPAPQVRVFFTADDEIRLARGHDPFGRAEQGAEEAAGKLHVSIIVYESMR